MADTPPVVLVMVVASVLLPVGRAAVYKSPGLPAIAPRPVDCAVASVVAAVVVVGRKARVRLAV
ncbi:hypothetical protein BDF19DRAFT_435824 [Syncephalis fuscata]|nr:hypothetical protein BDF19DRAFT_435824 [Syncephalis fuscata]